MRKVVATDPERMWAEDADVLTSKLEPGFMLQARYLVITPRARLQASATLAMAVLTMATLTMALLTMAIPTARPHTAGERIRLARLPGREHAAVRGL